MKTPSFEDFAADEIVYMSKAYQLGLRCNPMIGQCQRIVELWFKQIITDKLMNNNEVMLSRNLRNLYDYVCELGIDLSPIRKSVMILNNFYQHTRYPSKDSYIATEEDIELAVSACMEIKQFLYGKYL